MITVRRIKNFNRKKVYLDAKRVGGFAGLVIDPSNKKSVKLGVEMLARMMIFDKAYGVQ